MKRTSTLVPQLRFKEFESADPWEVKKLGEVLEVKSSKISLNKAVFEKNGYPLYGADGFLGYINFYECKEDYIAIIKDGAGVGRVYFYKGFSSVLGTLNYLVLNNKEKHNTSLLFIFYFLYIFNFKEFIVGSGIPHIYFKSYSIMNIPLPTIAEQEKIAAVLCSMDRLLELETQKLQHLEEHKKGLLQKLFPAEGQTVPQLRFKEFESADPWEVKKLGEVLEVKSSKISLNKAVFEKNGYPLYGADGFLGYINFYECKEDYIAIIKDGAGVGRVYFYKGFSSVLGTLNYLVLNNKEKHNTSLLFIFYFLYIFNFKEFIVGSGIPHIYFKSYSIMNIPLPRLAEQEKIATVLSSADQHITQQKQKVQALKQQKQYLLQNLFPQEVE